MNDSNIPKTGSETPRSDAIAIATKLTTIFPDNIEAVLEFDSLHDASQTAIKYIKAMVSKLEQLPRDNRKSWLQKNPEFMEWLASFPREIQN